MPLMKRLGFFAQFILRVAEGLRMTVSFTPNM